MFHSTLPQNYEVHRIDQAGTILWVFENGECIWATRSEMQKEITNYNSPFKAKKPQCFFSQGVAITLAARENKLICSDRFENPKVSAYLAQSRDFAEVSEIISLLIFILMMVFLSIHFS